MGDAKLKELELQGFGKKGRSPWMTHAKKYHGSRRTLARLQKMMYPKRAVDC